MCCCLCALSPVAVVPWLCGLVFCLRPFGCHSWCVLAFQELPAVFAEILSLCLVRSRFFPVLSCVPSGVSFGWFCCLSIECILSIECSLFASLRVFRPGSFSQPSFLSCHGSFRWRASSRVCPLCLCACWFLRAAVVSLSSILRMMPRTSTPPWCLFLSVRFECGCCSFGISLAM